MRDYTVIDETTHRIHPRQNGKTTFLAEPGKTWSDPTSDPIADMRAWAERVLDDNPPPGRGIVTYIAQHRHGDNPAAWAHRYLAGFTPPPARPYEIMRIHSAGLHGQAVYDWTISAWHRPAYCFTCLDWVRPFTNPVTFA